MSLFLVFGICGFLETWALLMFWGFSAGPLNAVPFVTLVGGLVLMLISTPLALFVPRLSAATAIVASTLVLLWPASMLVSELDPSGLMFAVPPLLTAVVAWLHIWRTRHSKWLVFAARPALWLRIILAAAPAIAFCLVFNAPLVLALVLTGPPR